MRRGFKAYAARLALEIRSEFGLVATGPFDPYAYFDAYGIPVIALSGLDTTTGSRAVHSARDKISGALIPVGSGFIALDNDFHSPARRRSTTAHECAHHILEHTFSASISIDARGCGIMKIQEDEADVLAGELLVPSAAARIHALANWSDEQLAEEYGVSIEFTRWRSNTSGARKFAASVQRRRKTRGQTRPGLTTDSLSSKWPPGDRGPAGGG